MISNTGFTLVETLVAVTILSISVVATMTMVMSGLTLFRVSQNEFIAASIAEEGIEVTLSKVENHIRCTSDSSCTAISYWSENLAGNWQVDASMPEQLKPDETFESFSSGEYICRISGETYTQCSDPSEQLAPKYQRELEIVPTDLNGDSVPEFLSIKSIVTWSEKELTDRQELVLERVVYNQ